MRCPARLLTLAWIGLLTCAVAQTAPPFTIESTRLLYRAANPAGSYVQLAFASAVPDELIADAVGSCTSDSLASGAHLRGTTITITLIAKNGTRRTLPGSFQVDLTDCFTGRISLQNVAANVAPTVDENQVELKLAFSYQGRPIELTQTGAAISNKQQAVEEVDKAIKAYNEKAPAKTSDQKNIFAGLSVTVPSGGGDAQGSADISLHKEFGQFGFLSGRMFDQLVAGVNLKKGSQVNADPRHFSLAFVARKDFLLAGRKTFQQIKTAIDSGRASEASSLVDSLPRRPFSALLLDTGLQFEGDIKGTSIGGISNLIYVLEPRLVSPTFGVPGTRSEAKFTILPVAIEVGKNLQNADDPAMDGFSIGRVKSGAALNVLLDGKENSAGGHLELDFQVVNRYLWQRETAFDPITKLSGATVSGNRYYADAALKFFFAKTPFGKPGFKLSFTRGSLPPTYSFNKVFNFGFVFESSDDKHEIK